jgi:kelch-like protein 10
MLAPFNRFPLDSFENSSDDEMDENSPPRQCMSVEAMTVLFEMRLNHQLCDAHLHLDDGRIFNVHRAVLCACSSYFK